MNLKAKLIDRKRLTDDVIEVVFRLVDPPEIEFQAGQFVNIKVADGNPKIHLRPYSFLSPPQEKSVIRFLLKVIPFGRSSEWLNTIEAGTVAEMFGPTGVFLFNEKSPKKTLMIATGTGIAPFLSMLRDQLSRGNQNPIHLLWGLRYMKDVYYREDLELLKKKYPNFSYAITLSRPEDEKTWTDGGGSIGRVTAWLNNSISNFDEYLYFICGVGDMVKDVETLLKEKNVAPEDIHYEKYTL